ncbi:hypothetical protein [Aureliella helgolandensis]|nr:hypothetical protein [Aureliella helgolandensis]
MGSPCTHREMVCGLERRFFTTDGSTATLSLGGVDVVVKVENAGPQGN